MRKCLQWILRIALIAVVFIFGYYIWTSYISAVNESREATCVSNMRMLTQSIIIYTQDHDGRLPDAKAWIKEITSGFHLIRDYGDPFDCVSSDHIGSITQPDYFMFASPDGGFLSGMKTTAISQSASTPCIAELKFPETKASYVASRNTSPMQIIDMIAFRHRKSNERKQGTNIVFCDGHVKYFHTDEINAGLFEQLYSIH